MLRTRFTGGYNLPTARKDGTVKPGYTPSNQNTYNNLTSSRPSLMRHPSQSSLSLKRIPFASDMRIYDQ